jgi:hypothetical protein
MNEIIKLASMLTMLICVFTVEGDERYWMFPLTAAVYILCAWRAGFYTEGERVK